MREWSLNFTFACEWEIQVLRISVLVYGTIFVVVVIVICWWHHHHHRRFEVNCPRIIFSSFLSIVKTLPFSHRLYIKLWFIRRTESIKCRSWWLERELNNKQPNKTHKNKTQKEKKNRKKIITAMAFRIGEHFALDTTFMVIILILPQQTAFDGIFFFLLFFSNTLCAESFFFKLIDGHYFHSVFFSLYSYSNFLRWKGRLQFLCNFLMFFILKI